MIVPSLFTMTIPCTFLWVCIRLRVYQTSDMSFKFQILRLFINLILCKYQFQFDSNHFSNFNFKFLNMQSSKKPTIFNPVKSHRIFFLAEILQPYYGSHPQHHFQQLETFETAILGNECLRKLYDLTIENLNMHNYSDAIFFCDKLLTLSSNHIGCVYLMGECYFRNNDFKKVHSLFQTYKVLSHNINFQLLAAKSLYLNKQYEQCLSILELHLDNTFINNKMESSKCFIRGQCHEAQQNKALAVQAYQQALQKDYTNAEAFNRLVDGQLVSGVQKEHLLKNINFKEEDKWLKQIYTSKIKQVQSNENYLGASMIDQQVKKDHVFDILVAKENINILCIKAKTHYQNYQIPTAYELCLKAIKKDPLCFEILPIYAACMLDLGLTGQLYYTAHNLVENYATHPVSWFMVGTYYFLCKKYEIARKYFQKAIMLDKSFVYAWIGMAHSFAVQDQSDQAMSIYRTIVRLFPGCAQAHLYMGMEYLRTNNLKTATLSLMKAKQINPTDPLIYSELGVINFKQKNYKQAKDLHHKALSLCQPDVSFWVTQTILTNLAHSYRKVKDYNNAIKFLEQCVSLNSTNPQTYFSLAFVYHLSNQLNKAICYYHKSLKFKHDNQFAQQMLQKALSDASELPWDSVYHV